MGARGTKPVPDPLKLVPRGRKADTKPPAEFEIRAEPLESPEPLTERQQRLWTQYLEPCWWLGQNDTLLCYVFVCLMDEYLMAPDDMQTARISEMRRVMGELHLTSSEQARIGVSAAAASPAAGYFAD